MFLSRFQLDKTKQIFIFFKRDFFSIISIKHIERGEEKQQENHLTCKRCFADNHLGFVEFVFWVLI